MANYTWSAAFHNTDDNSFRAWGKSVSDALTAIGLTRASDTGQVNWNTVNRPLSGEGGYEMWRFNDPLQVLYPVFIRLGYGTNPNYAANANLKIIVGTATDGAGNITSTVSTGELTYYNYAGAATQSWQNYASFDGSGLVLCIAINATGSNNIFQKGILHVERTRDGSSGDPNDRGVLVAGKYRNNMSYANTFRYSDGLPQSFSYPLPYVPANVTPGTSFLGPDNNIITYPGYGAFPELQYSKMTLGYSYADLGYGSTQTINHLGANRTYLSLGNYITGWSNTGNTAISPLIWWEDL